ncbi:MAG: hypothetical protein PHI37_02710 [Candidatus Gracilibacteria bacterium]|nr:hypothetical protein [Candidatus Gracilibacteria bacterium]
MDSNNRRKIIAIPSKNLGESGYNMYISIYKTLKLNGYTCYFLQPNKFVKEYLLKSGVDELDILELKENIYYIKKYSNTEKKEYKQIITFIEKFFGKLSFNSILNENLKEYSEYDYIIKKFNINTIIVYNGIFRIGRLVGLDNKCEIIYFENGYFPNTLQIDNKGINAESSITDIKYEELLKYKKLNNDIIKKVEIFNKNISINYFKKITLNLKSYNYKTNFFYTLFLIRKIIEIVKKNLYYNFLKEKGIEKNGKYIFIAFQVHDDTQLIFNSPIIKNMSEILDLYYNDINLIFPNYKIVVKEHPMDIGRINYSNLQRKYPDIIWIKKGNIDDIINKSEYVICINSSVGFQALSKYKKVFTLGENFYSNNPWVEKLENKESFKEQLIKLKDKKLDNKKIDEYIKIFKNELFINGAGKGWAWENYNEKTIKKICEYIVK